MKLYKHRVIKRASTNEYIFSGGSALEADGSKTYDYLWSYRFDSGSWDETYPRLGTGRLSHGVYLTKNEEDLIIAAGKMYINPNYIPLDSVEKYNFAARTWTYMNPIPGPGDYSFLITNVGVFTAISSSADTVFEYEDDMDMWHQRVGVVSAGVVFDSSLVDTEELYNNCG